MYFHPRSFLRLHEKPTSQGPLPATSPLCVSHCNLKGCLWASLTLQLVRTDSTQSMLVAQVPSATDTPQLGIKCLPNFIHRTGAASCKKTYIPSGARFCSKILVTSSIRLQQLAIGSLARSNLLWTHQATCIYWDREVELRMIHFGVNRRALSFSELRSKMSDGRFTLGVGWNHMLTHQALGCFFSYRGCRLLNLVCHFGVDILSCRRLHSMETSLGSGPICFWRFFFLSPICTSYKNRY